MALYMTIITCSVGAAVQGWDQTGQHNFVLPLHCRPVVQRMLDHELSTALDNTGFYRCQEGLWGILLNHPRSSWALGAGLTHSPANTIVRLDLSDNYLISRLLWSRSVFLQLYFLVITEIID